MYDPKRTAFFYNLLKAFKNGQAERYRILLAVTLVLGMAFLVLQYQGWLALQKIGVELTTNPSGSFVYVISAVHAGHIVGGIAALLVAIIVFIGFILFIRINRRKSRVHRSRRYRFIQYGRMFPSDEGKG